MIVHGDMDGAPIEQGEEAFMALWRQGKRARFVRYWGEGHVVASPANVRHLWSQIFDWLDVNLGIVPGARGK
jgi:dipeptidyl aminopeptidase/acylaminoacyl peptidase